MDNKFAFNFFIIIFICLNTITAYSEGVYTWTDENGITHIEDKPPNRGAKNGSFEVMNKPKEEPPDPLDKINFEEDIEKLYSNDWIDDSDRTQKDYQQASAYCQILQIKALEIKGVYTSEIKKLRAELLDLRHYTRSEKWKNSSERIRSNEISRLEETLIKRLNQVDIIDNKIRGIEHKMDEIRNEKMNRNPVLQKHRKKNL